MMNRAYSLLEIKSVKDDRDMIIVGTATTPTPDRVGDIVEPLGVKFTNPMPLLHHHDSTLPVGEVRFKKPTKDGIDFEARLPRIEEDGPLKDRVDTARQELKYGLVKGVSIGFREIEYARLEKGGLRFIESEVLEVSIVSVPANADCTIHTIKALDAECLAASGQKREGISSAGVAARKSTPVVKATEAKRTMAKKTIQERISAFEATRAAKAARMMEIQDTAADDEGGRTKDAAEKEAFDTLKQEIESIDSELVDLRAMEKLNLTKAIVADGKDEKSASQSRGGDVIRVSVQPNVEPGTEFARAVWCKVHGWMNMKQPADVAREQYWHDQTPIVERYLRVEKTAVAAGTTTNSTWASPLVEEMNVPGQFAELLRPATIIGRLVGLTRVPFNIKVPRETTAASVSWVGEGSVKPVSAMAFDQITLLFNKVAGIVPVTEELFRFSSPAIDAIIRNSLRDSIAYLLDRDFLDPSKAEVTGVSPASITNGVTAITATGTTADALRADLGTLLAEYTEDNQNLSSLVLIMTATQAMRIALMRNTLGQREFEGVGRDGGSLEGIPVVVSENIVPYGSPATGSLIVAVNAREILLADDGGVNIDVSREASLQMDTAPDSPATASTIMVSLWQRNLVALKAERFITWKKRRSTAVQYIQNAAYVG